MHTHESCPECGYQWESDLRAQLATVTKERDEARDQLEEVNGFAVERLNRLHRWEQAFIRHINLTKADPAEWEQARLGVERERDELAAQLAEYKRKYG